jgi:pilus assembly protein CpaF
VHIGPLHPQIQDRSTGELADATPLVSPPDTGRHDEEGGSGVHPIDTTARPVRGPAQEAALVNRVRSRLAASGVAITPAAVADAVRAEAGGVASDLDVLAALRLLRQEFVGAGPLDELLRDPRTTDVLVCGPKSVWVDRGGGLEATELRFPDESAVRRLAQRLAVAAGRRLDDASPFVDGWLADSGVRLHAVLSPVAADGTCLSLRVLRPVAHDLAALRRLGAVDATGEALLRSMLAARLAFLVSGGTGSGKTTILAALLSAVDPRERMIIVEEAEELRPRHPHVVRLVARPANIEGAGGVALRELVRQALRMRPDRIVVGEVRGAEVCELLAALNTGHEGGAGTVHANSVRELPARMEALAAVGGLPRAALHSQLAAAVQIVLHMRRERCGARMFEAAGALTRGATGEVQVRPVWSRKEGWTTDRAALGELLVERGVPAPW